MTHAFADELEKHVLVDMKRMLMKLCDDMPVLQVNEVMIWFDGYTKKTLMAPTPETIRESVSTKVDPNIEIMDGPSVEPIDVEPKKKTVARSKKKVVIENAEANAEANAEEDVPTTKKTAGRGKKKVVIENAEANAEEDVPKKKTAVRGKKKVVIENAEANDEATNDSDTTTGGVKASEMCDSYYPK